jgi:hypothetical protein
VVVVYRAASAVPRLRKGNTAGASAVFVQLLHKMPAWRFRGEYTTGRGVFGGTCHLQREVGFCGSW